MPGPAAAALIMPGAMAAAKRMAWEASVYMASPEAAHLTSAAFAAFLAQWLWKRIPQWIREDISFRALIRSSNGKSDSRNQRDELSHLASVLESFTRVAQSIEKLHNIPQIHATVLAYIQWSGQIKLAQLRNEIPIPKTRNYQYQNAGRSVPLAEIQSPEFQEPLQFATWAYHSDTERLTDILKTYQDFELLAHDQVNRPGNVAHFCALSKKRKQVYVGIRGTSSLEDIMTDCCGHAVPLEQEEGEIGRVEVEASRPHEIVEDVAQEQGGDGGMVEEVEIISGHERIRVEEHDHDGEYHIRCHEGILISARRLVRKIRSVLKHWIEEEGYELVLCGHSLGAGAAILASVIIRSEWEDIKDRIRVYAYAPPPVLDHDSAVAASSYVTSIVYNADMIPRCSLYNLSLCLQGLKGLHERLRLEQLNPVGPKSTAAFFGHLSKGTDAKQLLSIDEWHQAVEEGKPHIRQPDHLFVPGRVLLIYSPWSGDDSAGAEKTELKCIETNGAAPVLSTIEADGPRLFTDHVSSSYFEALGMEYSF